jgi:hypothetical protein
MKQLLRDEFDDASSGSMLADLLSSLAFGASFEEIANFLMDSHDGSDVDADRRIPLESASPEHDPEKRIPVLGKDHAPAK